MLVVPIEVHLEGVEFFVEFINVFIVILHFRWKTTKMM